MDIANPSNKQLSCEFVYYYLILRNYFAPQISKYDIYESNTRDYANYIMIASRNCCLRACSLLYPAAVPVFVMTHRCVVCGSCLSLCPWPQVCSVWVMPKPLSWATGV